MEESVSRSTRNRIILDGRARDGQVMTRLLYKSPQVDEKAPVAFGKGAGAGQAPPVETRKATVPVTLVGWPGNQHPGFLSWAKSTIAQEDARVACLSLDSLSDFTRRDVLGR